MQYDYKKFIILKSTIDVREIYMPKCARVREIKIAPYVQPLSMSQSLNTLGTSLNPHLGSLTNCLLK